MSKRLSKRRVLRKRKSFRKSLKRKSFRKKRKYKGGSWRSADCVKYKGETTEVLPHVINIYKKDNKTFYTLRIEFDIRHLKFSSVYLANKSYSQIMEMIERYTTFFWAYLTDYDILASVIGESIAENITNMLRNMGNRMEVIMSGTNIWFANEKKCRNRVEKINEVIKLLHTTVLEISRMQSKPPRGWCIVEHIMRLPNIFFWKRIP